MKSLLLASAAVIALSSAALANPKQINGSGDPAQAQNYGNGSAASASRSSSNATGGTATGGNAVARGGSATGGAGGAGGKGGQGGTSNVTVNGGGGGSSGAGNGYGRIPVAPAVPATIVNGGCNTGGASLVVQTTVAGVGGTLGGHQDIVCQSNEIGRADVAFAYLCLSDDKYRKAAKYTEHPCPDDEPKVQPVSFVMPIPPVPPVRSMPDGVPAWCGTTNGRDPVADRAACLRALNANIAHLRETH